MSTVLTSVDKVEAVESAVAAAAVAAVADGIAVFALDARAGRPKRCIQGGCPSCRYRICSL